MRTIPIKESLTIEFKSDKKKYSDADLVDEIVGMTNTKGGTLYLGVEDNGEVTGVHSKHKDAIGVTALIANSIQYHQFQLGQKLLLRKKKMFLK